ncbi:unnamed protein product [Rotaria socialis]|uniref:TOG domain-containing protein n=1 Tax=Rotaria socialis TaxID=392032 RepID=A0A817UEJ3_9BILA|nr:unnamed protein product [Rotaria socialis]
MATAAGGGDDNEWQKLPCDEKVQHKAWKARMTGYEECAKLFRSQDTDKSPEFSKYLGLVKKFVVDPNENAREKALDAIFAFVEEAQVAGKTVGEVAGGLIGKCLNGRTKMKDRAFDILLMYIEIERQTDIEDELIKGLDNKQPKIVQACLELLRRGLSEFGSKILPIKPFLKQVIPLLEDRDKSVRDEAKLLLVEVYRWIGKQTLTPMIQNVKPIQMQELQTEFDKLDLNGADKPRQTRFLRSQQDLKQKMEQTQASTTVSASVTIDDVNVEMQEELDPFEMLEAVNILDRLSKDFFEKIESKQWKDRKEVLDDLLALLTQNPKLAPEADYFELVKALKKIISKDSNIPVVIVAAKCLTGLAKGLKKGFKTHAVGVLEVCLDRFREKKPNVLEALREACEASYPATNLEQLAEEAVVVLAHKTPIVRQCTHQFLTKCFAMATQTTLPKKVLKIYLPPLIKNTGEADAGVRDSAFECLGMLWKCLGEKHILPHVTDLDELKLTKIKEYAEKAVLLNARGEPRTAGTSTAAVPKSVASSINTATMTKKPSGATIVKPDVTGDKDDASPNPASAAKPTTVVKKKSATTSKPAAASNEAAEEKRREPRPQKASVLIANVVSRVAPSQVKQTISDPMLLNEKFNTLKVQPITAPLLVKTTANVSYGTKHPIQHKSVLSTVGRSSVSPTVSSSSSSTNTQQSISFALTSTRTIINSTAIVRSTSNDSISSAINFNIKSRIPVRSEKPIDDPEWQKLPPDEKVQHKLWNARLTGYEECGKLFALQDSPKSGEFEDYLDLLPKFAQDTNENAKEKGLEALLVFIQEAFVARTTVGEIVPIITSKCLSGRPKIKERAFDILLMYIEIDKNAEIEEELIKGLDNKTPKIVQACLELLRRALSEFGSKVLPIKPFLPKVIPLLEDRDKTVRDEAKLLLVEIYRWVGKQTLTPMIQNVKPIQMQELQTEFDKLDLNGADKPRQTRFLRSQQNVKKKQEQEVPCSGPSAPAAVDDVDTEAPEELDPLEMLDAANILDRLSKDFFEKIESKQWKDRKEVLDDLLALLTQNPKLAPEADYFELVKALSKIISKDSNVPVVIVTAKCMTGLAKGLRKAFKNHTINVLEVCLDRFREKKPNVLEALRETCEAAYPGTNLEQMAEVAVAVLAHKTPIVRQSTQQFLTKCFAMATQTTLPKKVLKLYLPPLIKNTGEADAGVRDSAFECLGMLWKCLGEKHVLPHVTDLDELKLTKIKEYAEKAVLLNARGEPRPPPSAAPPPLTTIVKTIKGGGAVVVKPEVIVATREDDDDELPNSSPPPKASTATVKKKPVAGGKAGAGAAETTDDKKKDTKGKATVPPSGKTPPNNATGGAASTTVKGGRPVAGKGRPSTAPSPPKQIAPEPELAKATQDEDLQRPATAHRIQSKIEKKPGQFQLGLDDDHMDALRLPDLVSSELPHDFDLPDLPPRTYVFQMFLHCPKAQNLFINFSIATTSIPASFLAASSDCRQSIDLVIALIADHEVANSLSSLAQIDEVLNDANKCVYLEQHVDKLLRMLSMKLRIAQQNHLYDSSLPSDSVERLFRGILSVLLDLFSRPHLAKLATRDTLKELLNVLLPFVVVTITPTPTPTPTPTNHSHNLASRIDAASNEDFIRIVNVIVLKILQNAHMTNVLTALIRLLTECCLPNDFSINDPFVKLVLKCHYRLVRMFPLSLKNNPLEIDATQILVEISSFLKQLPSRRWQSSPNNDFPLRIIKTYLQQLVDERQRSILDDLSRIPNDQQPISDEMRHYIHRKLKAITVSSTNSEQVTQQHQVMLKTIFQKFARREQVKVGLEELYDFKLRFPNVDINPFLATTADAFQKFIHEGLARVHTQRTAAAALNAASSTTTTTNLTSPSSTILRDKTQATTSIPTQASPNSFYSQYAQIHEEKLRALKEQFVWIDTLPTSSNIEQQKTLVDDDFVTIYNKRMAAIKEKFRDQLGNTFASSSTPIDPQIYAQHLTQMRQQCGLAPTPITTGQDAFDVEVESRLNNGGAAGGSTTGVNARLAAARSSKTSEPQVESSTFSSAPIDASAQRSRELLRQRLERVKQGIIE